MKQVGVKRIESLKKGLEVLQAFSTNPAGLRLPEVTRLSGLPKATAYRFLQTLLEQNYLHYFPDSGVFRLGPRVMSLGFSTLLGFDIAELAQPYLTALSKKIGQNVNLGVLDGTDAVYLVRIRVQTIVGINLTVGSRVAAHNSAIGRALLAHLSDERLEAVITGIARDPQAAARIGPGGRKLKEQLREVRERGFALTDGEFVPGLASIAAPVFNEKGDAEAAINVPVYTQICTVRELVEVNLPFLLETASTVSELRGHGAARQANKGG